jgi:hypothetical protein
MLDFSMFLRETFGHLCLALVAGCAVVACAVNPKEVQGDTRDQMLSLLREGRVVLDCELLCSHEYIFRQNTIVNLYGTRQWEDLGIAMMQAGWRQDVTYYLLGLSAEQLGYLGPADGYYRIAIALATGSDLSKRCASVARLCRGVSQPREAQVRLHAVEPQFGRRDQIHARRSSRRRSARHQPPRSSSVPFMLVPSLLVRFP